MQSIFITHWRNIHFQCNENETMLFCFDVEKFQFLVDDKGVTFRMIIKHEVTMPIDFYLQYKATLFW